MVGLLFWQSIPTRHGLPGGSGPRPILTSQRGPAVFVGASQRKARESESKGRGKDRGVSTCGDWGVRSHPSFTRACRNLDTDWFPDEEAGQTRKRVSQTRKRVRRGSGSGPILLSQATFLLAHIANSGPVPLSPGPAFRSPGFCGGKL